MIETFELPTSVDDLHSLEHKLLDWTLAGRPDKIVEYLDPNFTVISFHGNTLSRREYVQASLATKVESGHFESLEITQEQNFAITNGLVHIKWSLNGMKMEGPMRFSKVWVRRPAGWRALHLHTTDARLGASWAQMFGKPLGLS